MKINDHIANIVPWFAPVPTAWFVGFAVWEELSAPVLIAVATALTVETFGFSAASTALELFDYNRTKRKPDPSAPLGLTVALVLAYAVVVITLTVLLKIIPNLAVYSLAVFPLFSLAGVTLIAVRHDHKRRIDAIDADKRERKEQRLALRALHDATQETHQKMDTSYPCELCDAVLPNAGKYAAHMRWQHGEDRKNGRDRQEISTLDKPA